MKRSIVSALALLLGGMLFLTGCFKDQCGRTMTYVKFEPVFKTLDQIRKPVVVTGARAMQKPGKIYVYNNYVLINEQRKGVHVLDNTDPTNPVKVAFIEIEGNIDMAVRNGIMYADNYTDLLAIDITNPAAATLVRRVEHAFPTYGQDPDKGYLVYYEGITVTEKVDCERFSRFQTDGPVAMLDAAVASAPTFSGATAASVAASVGGTRTSAVSSGTAGSMARFAVVNNALYVLDHNSMRVFNVSNASSPEQVGAVGINAVVETIYPFGPYALVGTTTGMFVYDISDAFNPQLLSQFEHATACDPVVADGNTAYVTLRSGTGCGGWQNLLITVDISNIRSPREIQRFNMTQPMGLSVRNNTLYLCDGTDGLKVFNATNPSTVGNVLLSRVFVNAYDVISLADDHIMVVGNDGFYQFNTSNVLNPQLLSRIRVQ